MTSKTPIRACEDMDEATLSYSEIKALATGNPLIKEKMTLDNDLTKLKMLEASYKSNRFSLEDKVLKTYPNQIEKIEQNIKNVKSDIVNREPRATNDDKFSSMEVLGTLYTDKKKASESLMKAIKTVKIGDEKSIGRYRNFDIIASYNTFFNEYSFTLKGNANHNGSFGNDNLGNLTRMDNVIDKLEEKLKTLENKLESTKENLENAKEELKKPFDKADELKEKLARLTEINHILDLGEVNDKVNDNPLMESAKKSIIKFANREYDEDNKYEAFNDLYPDLKNIGIAYGNTPDEKYEISFVINLEDLEWYQKVDDMIIEQGDFKEPSSTNMSDYPLNNVASLMNNTSWEDLIRIEDTDALKEKLGLEIDDDGNFYDPLSLDMDNDGIIDRYDNDFKDSDYLESTFDIDGLKKDEKPSIREQIKQFKEEEKEKSISSTKLNEIVR